MLVQTVMLKYPKIFFLNQYNIFIDGGAKNEFGEKYVEGEKESEKFWENYR